MSSGRGFEQCISAVLKTRYEVKEQYQTDWIGLFGNKIKVDFYLPQIDLCIEVKWQSTAGTAEQKLVYAVNQANDCHQSKHTIIVLGGDGWSPGCKKWAKAHGCLTVDELFEKVIKGGLDG